MEYSNWPINVERINVLKKIILSYLEQYMVYYIEHEVKSLVSLKKIFEEQNLKCLFKVLSKGLLLNIEQFIKSRKWMTQENPNSIKNITITSINIIPEEHEKQLSATDSDQEGYEQVSSDSLNVFETIVIPEGEPKLGDNDETNLSGEWPPVREDDKDIINGGLEYNSGLLLGKLTFISLSLMSINKILGNKLKMPDSSDYTQENVIV